jgi:hypothetical protein
MFANMNLPLSLGFWGNHAPSHLLWCFILWQFGICCRSIVFQYCPWQPVSITPKACWTRWSLCLTLLTACFCGGKSDPGGFKVELPLIILLYSDRMWPAFCCLYWVKALRRGGPGTSWSQLVPFRLLFFIFRQAGSIQFFQSEKCHRKRPNPE